MDVLAGCGGLASRIFYVFYNGFGSGGRWRSGKSWKYEGGELNCSRKIMYALALDAKCSIKIMYALALDANCLRKIVHVGWECPSGHRFGDGNDSWELCWASGRPRAGSGSQGIVLAMQMIV